ncbi:MAG: hypothetical protein R2568_00605 [Candidatus Scalindua sp.]|jgi:hypothetical protein|nr:hypothetical protein [Candidatus Scalindua sp.]MDV5165232.1 hypothetical protein [Candidatus Scalindua sp.]
MENAKDIAQIKKTRDKNRNGLTLPGQKAPRTRSHKERKEKTEARKRDKRH